MDEVTPSEGYDSLQDELTHLCELLDKISERCAWDKQEFECTYTQTTSRKTYKMWLARCGQLEVALGL